MPEEMPISFGACAYDVRNEWGGGYPKNWTLGTKSSDLSLQQGVEKGDLQRSAKRLVRGCEKFVLALAYLCCLALPGSCLARFAYFLADLCMSAKTLQ